MPDDPFDLAWTPATIDLFKSSANSGVHVMNHDLSTPGAVDRTLRFSRARLRWFARQLPEGATLAAGDRERVRATLPANVLFLSEQKS